MTKKTDKPTLDTSEYFGHKSGLTKTTMEVYENQHDNIKALVRTVNHPRVEGQGEIRITEPLKLSGYIKDRAPEKTCCLIDGRPATPEQLTESATVGDLFRIKLTPESATLELVKCLGTCVYAIAGEPVELIKRLTEELQPQEIHFYHGNREVTETTMCHHVRLEDSFMVEAFGGRINITLLDGEKQPKVYRMQDTDTLVGLSSLWVEHLKQVGAENPMTRLKGRALTTQGRDGRTIGKSSRHSIYGPHIEFSTRIVEGFMTEERTDQLRALAETLECYVGNTKCDVEEFLHIIEPDDILLLQVFTSSARLVINQAVGVFQHPIKDVTEETKKVVLRRAWSMLMNSTFGAFGTPYTLTAPKTYLGPKIATSPVFINYLTKDDLLISHSLGASSAISCQRADKEDYSESKLLVNCEIYPTNNDGVYTDLLDNEFIKDLTDTLVERDLILPNWETRANHNILKNDAEFFSLKHTNPVDGLDVKHARARAEAKAKQPRKELSPLMKHMLKRL